MTKQVIKLSSPIQAHGDSISELTIPAPTGEQVCKIGLPYTMTPEGEANISMKKVKFYLVELAGIPASSVEQMSPSDLNNAGWMVASFFLKG